MKRKSRDAGTPVPAKVSKTAPRIRSRRNGGKGRNPAEGVDKTPTKKVDTRSVKKKNPMRNDAPQEQAPAKKGATRRKAAVTKPTATRRVAAKKEPVTKKKAAPEKKATPKKRAMSVREAAQEKKPTPKKKVAKKVAKKSLLTKRGQTEKAKGDTTAKKVPRKRDREKPAVHTNDKLTPNPAIAVPNKDILFEEKNNAGSPEPTIIGKAKSAIKAVMTNDMALLKQLISSWDEVPSLFIHRSVDIKEDALCTAMRMNNLPAIKLLLAELMYNNAENRMKMELPTFKKSHTGRHNYLLMYEPHQRYWDADRDREDKNAALTEDIRHHYYRKPGICTYIDFAANNIDNMDILNVLLKYHVKRDSWGRCKDCGSDECNQSDFLERIWQFARRGAHKIAGKLAKMAHEEQIKGFNHRLHYEILTCSRPEEMSQIKRVQVGKRLTLNKKLTPLHLSAINPNPDIIQSLLAVAPKLDIKDVNGYRPIHCAAACEGSGPLEVLLSRGVHPNQATNMGLTPLMIASKLGRTKNMIVLLRSKKSNPLPAGVEEENFVDSKMKSFTPLHFAAEDGQAEACKILIDHGASLEARIPVTQYRQTPVMLASRYSHFGVVKVLVEAKASLDARDKLKRTPLIHAVINGNYVIASYLLRNGADPNSRDTSGNTPMHYAAAYGWWHCIRVLLKAGADANTMNNWKIPPLYAAFIKGHTDCAEILVNEAGVEVDFRDPDGWSLLIMVVSRPITDDTLREVKLLAEGRKVDVTLQDPDGWNAMHHLASSPVAKSPAKKRLHHLKTVAECAKLLVKQDQCDLSAKTNLGETPIYIAMQQDPINTGLIELMLSEGATISLDAGADGENILHLLAKKVTQSDQSGLFDLLWKWNSSDDGNQLSDLMEMQDSKGFTPLLRLATVYYKAKFSCSLDEFFTNVAALMKSFVQKGGANIDYVIKEKKLDTLETESALFFFIYAFSRNGKTEPTTATNLLNTLRAFLSLKPKLNVYNCRGYTPLTLAITSGAKAEGAAKLLIAAGADVSLTACDRNSPVMLAADKSLFTLVEILLTSGAAIPPPDSKMGSGLLHKLAAAKLSHEEVIKCFKICLKRGCDVNAQDSDKHTTLHLAVEALTSDLSSTEVVNYLLEHGADVLVKDGDGRLPLHYAFYKQASPDDCSQLDPIEVVTMLTTIIGGQAVDTCDVLGRSPLHYAAYRGAIISFTHLLEHNTDLHTVDKLGNTPLSFAVKGGHKDIAILLIQGGADITVPISSISKEFQRWEKEQSTVRKIWEVEKKVWEAWKWQKMRQPPPARVTSVSLLSSIAERGWQGVLYLLTDRLERFGLPKTAVFQAVLDAKKWEIALGLVGKMKNLLNDKRQNMLHVLALNSEKTGLNEEKREHLQVAASLMSLNIEPTPLDAFGCSALTYAILAGDCQLCSLLIDHDKKKAQQCLSAVDSQGCSAFSAFFYHEVFHEDMWKLLCEHGLSPDQDFLMPDWSEVGASPPSLLLDCYHIWKPPRALQTPLVAAIKTRNCDLVKFLLRNGADVNKAGADLVTPIMAAVRANDYHIVHLLIKQDYGKNPTETVAVDQEGNMEGLETLGELPDVDFLRLDKDRRNVFHYLLLGHKNGTFENTSILNLLAQHAPVSLLTSPDMNGQSPLDLAVSARAEKLIAAMEELTKQRNVGGLGRPRLQWSDGIQWKSPNQYDSIADADATLAEIIASGADQSEVAEQKVKLDPLLGLTAEVEVVKDMDQGIPYSVLLHKVDAEQGVHGMNTFYKMQIVHQRDHDVHHLFARWGCIGDQGQHQRTPFVKAEEAIKKFREIFNAKTGNQWANMKLFTYHPGKYMFMDVRHDAGCTMVKDFNFDLASDIPSELPESLQELLKILTNVRNFKSIYEYYSGVDEDLMPFGQLRREIISLAKEILVKIRKLNEEIQQDGANSKSSDKTPAKMDQILDLSLKYYQLIPHSSRCKLCLLPHLNRPEWLKRAEKSVQDLTEIEIASRILLGAQYRIKEINPLDYVYRALDYQIQLLDEDSSEAQLILQQIEQTRPDDKLEVEAIYHLARDKEEDDLYNLRLDNHQLLWHGVKMANLMGIMKQGILTQSVESRDRTGRYYGQGIYTSPIIAKSVRHCQGSYHHFMVLCEVAAGKVQTNVRDQELKPGYNSMVLGTGQKFPDETFNLRLKSGASFAMGEMVNREVWDSWKHDSIVAYSKEQVCLRYLVQYRRR